MFERKNITLCGFMGCGKTTIGKQLSQKIFYKFIDTDEYIEQMQKIPVEQIFVNSGESYFRSLEKKAVEELSKLNGYVISTGGGTLKDAQNVEEIKKHSKIIYINTDFDSCYDRIKDCSLRPILNMATAEQLRELYEERKLLYSSVCDYEVFNNGQVSNCISTILASIEKLYFLPKI